MAQGARDVKRTRQWAAGSRMRARREALGMTQKDLVPSLAEVGLIVSEATISTMEHGGADVAAKVVPIAAALRCSTTYLLGGTENPEKWTPDVSAKEWATRVYLDAIPSPFELIDGLGMGLGFAAQLPIVRSVK